MDLPIVEMVTIGDELLSGRSVDTNAAALGRFLAGYGVEVRRRVTVPDDSPAIVGALRDALEGADLVVVCGGLGSTTDDVSRRAAADLLGVELAVDEDAARAIRARRARFGRPFNEGERRMAAFPVGARVVENPRGAAPGFAIEIKAPSGTGRHTAVFFPGVPDEFEAMLEPALAPLVGASATATGARRTLTCSVFGVTESELDERLRPFEVSGATWFQYRARFPVVRVTIVAQGLDEAAWDAAVARFRATLGDNAYGDDDVSQAEVVVAHLGRLGLRLATAESCTGGLIATQLTEVAGASAVFDLGLVTYANRQKRDLLGVSQDVLDRHGAVSRETVEQMARGARERAGADLAVAVSGVAGPGGGTAEKPVGTVHFALATAEGVSWREGRFPGSRTMIRRWAAGVALDMVRRDCERRRA